MAVFAAIVEQRSFSAAAARLGIATSSASRQIRALERRLGVKLLDRTTRQVRATDTGAAFYERCLVALGAAAEAEAVVTEPPGAPRGRLRVVAPALMGRHRLSAIVADYVTLYPQVEVELDVTPHPCPLTDTDADIALHIGRISHPALTARRLCAARWVVVASPSYLAEHPPPRSPADLGAHECLRLGPPPARTWRFVGPDGDIHVPVRGRLRSNDPEVIVSAACDGLGLARVPDLAAAVDVRTGRLASALAGFCPSLGGIHVAYRRADHLSDKIRRFVDELVASFCDP